MYMYTCLWDHYNICNDHPNDIQCARACRCTQVGWSHRRELRSSSAWSQVCLPSETRATLIEFAVPQTVCPH